MGRFKIKQPSFIIIQTPCPNQGLIKSSKSINLLNVSQTVGEIYRERLILCPIWSEVLSLKEILIKISLELSPYNEIWKMDI